MEKIAACSHSRYSLKHKHTHIRVYLWMWLFVFCWQSLLTLCLTLVIFCHVSELKFLTQWTELIQHHLEIPGPSSGWPIQKVKDMSLLHMCIAVLKHAKEKMGEQVWSEQREDTSGWTCMKQEENCSSLRGWFRVPFVLLLPEDEGYKSHLKQLPLAVKVRWSNFSLFSPTRRTQKDPWVRLGSTEAFQ